MAKDIKRDEITIEGFRFNGIFFLTGLKVRVLKTDENEIMGSLCKADENSITIKCLCGNTVAYTEVKREEIKKMRRLKPNETFSNTLYFDDEEEEKWRKKYKEVNE